MFIRSVSTYKIYVQFVRFGGWNVWAIKGVDAGETFHPIAVSKCLFFKLEPHKNFGRWWCCFWVLRRCAAGRLVRLSGRSFCPGPLWNCYHHLKLCHRLAENNTSPLYHHRIIIKDSLYRNILLLPSYIRRWPEARTRSYTSTECKNTPQLADFDLCIEKIVDTGNLLRLVSVYFSVSVDLILAMPNIAANVERVDAHWP